MSMFANNVLLGGGVRIRVGAREQRKIKKRSKALYTKPLMGKVGHHSLSAACSTEKQLFIRTQGQPGNKARFYIPVFVAWLAAVVGEQRRPGLVS